MKKLLKNVGIAIKQFFSSFWEDFKRLVKEHWLKLVGFIIMFIVPVVVLLVEYIEKVPNKAEKITMPICVFIPLIVLLLVYWGKAKRYFAIKLQAMKTENSLQKGKHAGAIIVCTTIQALSTILPFALGYILFKALADAMVRIEDIFLFLTICEAVGGLFVILDTVRTCVDYSEEENESNEN